MNTKKIGKFEIAQCTNGYILSLINPNYAPSEVRRGLQSGDNSYILGQYIASTPKELADMVVTMLVETRLDQIDNA